MVAMSWLTTVTAAPRCDPCAHCRCLIVRPPPPGRSGGFHGPGSCVPVYNLGSGCYPRGHRCYGWTAHCIYPHVGQGGGNSNEPDDPTSGGSDGSDGNDSNGAGSAPGGSGEHP
ncbi:hypothetical protein FRB95_011439 [Tulasnella sp. JGI-2019a]|nr:hypothetical protein FRB95_011439 [Tulasnella sp. JGI-2019a]